MMRILVFVLGLVLGAVMGTALFVLGMRANQWNQSVLPGMIRVAGMGGGFMGSLVWDPWMGNRATSRGPAMLESPCAHSGKTRKSP